jgi:UDP-N-acetylglucosamine acyltransferase
MIHPSAIIDPKAEIDTDVEIGPYSVIADNVSIGSGSVIGPHVTVAPYVSIEPDCHIFLTEIGEKNLLMAYCHVAHDCQTGREVILANNATLAGHIVIGDYVTVGGLVAIHQFVRIGEYAYVGGKTAVPKDIPPYVIASGDRAKLYGLNRIGLKRHGFSESAITALKKVYRIFFRYGITINEAIERAQAEVDHLPEVVNFINFIKSSQRGITR